MKVLGFGRFGVFLFRLLGAVFVAVGALLALIGLNSLGGQATNSSLGDFGIPAILGVVGVILWILGVVCFGIAQKITKVK